MMDENEGRRPIRRRSSKRASGGILKLAEKKPLAQIFDLNDLDENDTTMVKRPKRNKKRVSFQSTKNVKTFCGDGDFDDKSNQNMFDARNGQEEEVDITRLSDDGIVNDTTLRNNITIDIQKRFLRNFCDEDTDDLTFNMAAQNYVKNPPSPVHDIGNKTIRFCDDMNSETDTYTFNFSKSSQIESIDEDSDQQLKASQQDFLSKLYADTEDKTSSVKTPKEKPTNMDFILNDNGRDVSLLPTADPIPSSSNFLSFIKKADANESTCIEQATSQANMTTVSEMSMNVTELKNVDMIMQQLESSMMSSKQAQQDNLNVTISKEVSMNETGVNNEPAEMILKQLYNSMAFGKQSLNGENPQVLSNTNTNETEKGGTMKQMSHVFGSAANTLQAPLFKNESALFNVSNNFGNTVDSNFRDKKVEISLCEETPDQSVCTTPQQGDDSSGERIMTTGETPSFIETFNNKINLVVGEKEAPEPPLIHNVTSNRMTLPPQPQSCVATPLIDSTRVPDLDPSETFSADEFRKSAFTPVRINKTMPLLSHKTMSPSTDVIIEPKLKQIEMSQKKMDVHKTGGLKEMSNILQRFTATKSSTTITDASLMKARLSAGSDEMELENSAALEKDDILQVRVGTPSPVKKISENKESDQPHVDKSIRLVEEKEEEINRMTYTSEEEEQSKTYTVEDIQKNVTSSISNTEVDQGTNKTGKTTNDRRRTYTINDFRKNQEHEEEEQPKQEVEKKKMKNDRRRTFTVGYNTILAEDGKLQGDGKWLDESILDDKSIYFKPPIAHSSVMITRGDCGLLTDDDTTSMVPLKPEKTTENIAELVGKAIADAEKSLLKHLRESPLLDLDKDEEGKDTAVEGIYMEESAVIEASSFEPNHNTSPIPRTLVEDGVAQNNLHHPKDRTPSQVKKQTHSRKSTSKKTPSYSTSTTIPKIPTITSNITDTTSQPITSPMERLTTAPVTPPQSKSKYPLRRSACKQALATPPQTKPKTPTRKSTTKKTPSKATRRTPSRKAKADRPVSPEPENEETLASDKIHNNPTEEEFLSDPFASRPKIPRGDEVKPESSVQTFQGTGLEEKTEIIEPMRTELSVLPPPNKDESSYFNNSVKTTGLVSSTVVDKIIPSFKRSNKDMNSPSKGDTLQHVDQVLSTSQVLSERSESNKASKDGTNTKKRKHRKRVNMPSRGKRKVRENEGIKKIQDDIQKISNGFYNVDKVGESDIVASFRNQKFKLHIQLDGSKITKIEWKSLFDEWLPTGEAWYISTMGMVLNETCLKRLLNKYTDITQIPQLLSDVEKLLSSWHPFVCDVYQTFKQNLGRVKLTSNRMTYKFLVTEKKYSSFFLHVDFDASQEDLDVKYSLEHRAFYFLLDDVKQLINDWREGYTKQEQPIMETCSRIKKFCENIEAGVQVVTATNQNKKIIYDVEIN